MTPPSLLETVTDLFLPATPSPSSSLGANIHQTASAAVPDNGDLPSFVAPSAAASTSSHRSLSVDSTDPTWQSVSWYDQPGPSTIASGSSTISGAFLCLPSTEDMEEELDIWADDYKVANSDDRIL